MFSIESFKQTYETETVSVKVQDKPYSFIIPQNLDALMPREGMQFPLWAKIWEAAIVLADHMVSPKMETSGTLLELGAGLGVTSVIADSHGYNVTATEYDSHAIQFIHANSHINECIDLRVDHLDWHNPKIDTTFDKIIGSELIYKETDFESLLALFKKFLKPDGEIYLAFEPRKATKSFLDMMSQWYQIGMWRKQWQSSEDTQKKTILVVRLIPKT